MLLYMIACVSQPILDEDEPDFLEQVTNRWWDLIDEPDFDYDFCLAEAGRVWLNTVGAPNDVDAFNVDGGTWSYEGDGKFQMSDDGLTYTVTVRRMDDDPDCYRLIYSTVLVRTACPYEGPFD